METIVTVIVELWEKQTWIIPVMAIAIALVILAPKFLTNTSKKARNGLIQNLKLFWLNLLQNLAIEAWIRFTNPILFQYYQKLRQNYLEQQDYLFISPHLSLEVSCPLPQTIQPKNPTHKTYKIWDFLAKINQKPEYKRLGILATVGGKTQLLENLVKTYSENHYLQYQAPSLIPFLLPLRKLYPLISPHNPNLAQLIQQFYLHHSYLQQPVNFPIPWLEKYLIQGKCLILCDGLDEIGKNSHLQQVRLWLDQQIETYPNNVFIITSKWRDCQVLSLDNLSNLMTIQPFDFDQIKTFIIQWYNNYKSTSSRRRKKIKIKQNNQRKAKQLIEAICQNQFLAKMAHNPLLLSLITRVDASEKTLPKTRNELYQKICEVLLNQEYSKLRYPIKLTLEHRKTLLQILALELMKQNTLKFTLEEAEVILNQKLASIVETRLTIAEFINLIQFNSNLLTENQGNYEFSHLSFQEYLAGMQLKNTNEESLILEKLSNPFWRETIIFYGVQTDITNLSKKALENPSIASLSLVYQCLEEGLISDQNVAQQLEECLINSLESSDPELFDLAAKVYFSRRLNYLRNQNQKVVLDNSLITCVEYQLFINHQSNLGENRQPYHWNSNRFPSGNATDPITGIRASDAKEFCEWLTQWTEEIGFEYRIPTLAEVEESPIFNQSVGYWCHHNQENLIAGINAEEWSILEQKLGDLIAADPSSHVIENRNKNLDFTRILAHDLDLDLALNTARETAHNLSLELGQNTLLNRSLDSVITQSYTRALIDRNLSINYIKDLARTLESALQLSPNPELDLPEIGSYLLLVSGFWYRLAIFYQNILSDSQQLKQQKLNQKSCQDLIQKFTQKGDEAFNLYVFFLLIEERRTGNMSAWEGIRIVRQKIS
jgi:hypothetical protein